MATVIHQSDKEIWVFASKQMGVFKALVNMLKEDNEPLEEMAKAVVDEAKGVLPEGAKIEDIKIETSDLNGPTINVTIKAITG